MAQEAIRVAQYVLWLGRETAITPMRLLKLVYISHGWMLAVHDKPLFTDIAEAWQYGPVVPSVYHAYKRFGGSTITDIPQEEPQGFGKQERELMAEVWKVYSSYTALQLSALTHQPNTPWAITRELIGPGGPISDDLIKEHYLTLAKAQ